MEDQKKKQIKKLDRSFMDGFSPVSSTRIDWKSRKRSSSVSEKNKVREDTVNETIPDKKQKEISSNEEIMQDAGPTEPSPPELSERRKALFEPLEPMSGLNGLLRPPAESLLPPPDFDSASYPRGWLIGKKRKLVNIDVVESMRRIAIQEMNRKDREIGELNEILDEDSKVLELVQAQLLDERVKTSQLERENAMLRDQVKMLMEMLEDGETMDDDVDELSKGDNGPNDP